MTTKRIILGKPRISDSPSANGRADGFIELPWYSRAKFLATKANSGKGWDLIFTGPSSGGKTTAAYMLAHDLRYDIIVQQCHKRVEVEDFRGSRSIIPGKGNVPVTGFDPGSLTLAVQRCATSRGIVYLIDEINLVDPAMLAILNNLTQRDAHSALSIPEMQQLIPRPSNLLIVGTMNPEYAGTNQLSEAFLSRIVKVECPMMSVAQTYSILQTKYPKARDMCMISARIMGYIETSRTQGKHQYEPDLRTMMQFIDLWVHEEPDWSRGDPLTTMSNCFDEIIGPKIGWKDLYSPIRCGLAESITTSLGSKLASTPVGESIADDIDLDCELPDDDEMDQTV